MAMYDLIFLMVAIVFVLVAFATMSSTLNPSPRVKQVAHRVVHGSCIAALASVALALWFLYRAFM